MSRCQSTEWSEQLPWVLLGLRTAPKEVDDVSPAERVYGKTIHVPADFFPCPTLADVDATRAAVSRWKPVPQTYRDDRTQFVPSGLQKCSHAFLRINAAKPPLTPSYSGSYLIKDRKEKTLRLQTGNKLE